MDKSPIQTFSTWITTTIYVLMLILWTVSGQTVRLESMEGVTTCTTGLRDGIDFYLFKGIVDASIAKYSNLIDFQIKSASSSSFTYLCTASLVTCVTPNPQPCYCAVNKTGNIYEIVANRSAVLADNHATIRIQWDSSSGASVVSNEINVPEIYDPSIVTTNFTINGTEYKEKNCPKEVNNGSVIEFQCSTLLKPCDVSIAINGKKVAYGVSYVMYKFPSYQVKNETLQLTWSYSVCGGARTDETCTINLVTKDPVTLKHWAVAMSVIYYISIIVIIGTSIVILVFAIKLSNKTVIFYVCIGFLVFSEILCIVLIIVFAQAAPYDSGTEIALDLWKIMLIIFCIINGLLLTAAVVVVIWSCVCSKKSNLHTSPNRGSAEITSPATVNTSNARTKMENKLNSNPNANSVSNGKDKTDTFHLNEMQGKEQAKLHNTPDEIKKDESVGLKKGKNKKSKQKNKVTKEHEQDGSSTNRSLPVPLSGDNKLPSIHPQPPTGTKMSGSLKNKDLSILID